MGARLRRSCPLNKACVDAGFLCSNEYSTGIRMISLPATDTVIGPISNQWLHNRVRLYSFVAACFRSNVGCEVYGKLLVEMTVAACFAEAGGYRPCSR